jgi:hypothetical protein
MCISVLATVAILWQSALAAPAKPEPAAPRAAAPASAPAPAARPAGATSQPACPFDSMDDATVAKNLAEFQMGELLAALAEEDANSPDIAKRAVASDVMLDQAGKLTDQKTADEVIDKAVKILDNLIAVTKNANPKDFVGKANYYKLRMSKINAEGMVRLQLCIQRMEYLLDSPADRERMIRFADAALQALAGLETDINAELANWRAIPEARVTGALYQLEELQKERRFRDGWLQFYRAAATAKTVANKQQRGDMLNQAIDSAKDFLSAGDANDPARVKPLLLAGMASREMGKAKEAGEYFTQMAKLGSTTDQLRAAFEKAHTAIESGAKVEDALNAIKDFQKVASTVEGVRPVAIAMQAVLLRSHLYEAQAEALKTSDPIASKKMAGLSIGEIMGFIKANPNYMQAFLEIVGPRYEGQNVDDLPPQVVVALGLWHGAKTTPASATEAERLLKNALARTDFKEQSSVVLALGEMGRIYENQKQYARAAASFRTLAERFPQDKHGKAAAMEAVKCMDRVLNPKDAKPTDPKPSDDDQAEYTQDLQVLMKNWGDKRPENKDVQDYHYLLGAQLENVSKSAQAIAEYELVAPESRIYLLAKYHALGLRASVMMDTPPANAAQRTVQAKALIAGAAAFHDAAVVFKTSDKGQADSVRTMGAEMDLMAAQVYLQILKQNPQARAAAEKAVKDWPGMADIADRATVLQVQTYLAERNLNAAIGLMDKIKENTAVMAQVVKEIRLVIERLDPDKDAEALKELMSVFPLFAEKVYDAIVAANPNASEQAMYPYKQVKALAYEYTDDKAKLDWAAKTYNALNKQKKDDAINIRGMARCYRKLNAPLEAMNCYNQLVNGLKRLSPEWWKAQLERAQFSVEVNARRIDEIRKVILELRRLADDDPGMGGPTLLAKFKEVQAKAQTLVPAAASAPAAAPKPVVAAKPATPAKTK